MNTASGAASDINSASTVKPSNACLRVGLVVLLAHRDPRVGVHGVGAGDGVSGRSS